VLFRSVRQEVEAGLRREIPVIPVLVGGARLPSPEHLPDTLRPLLRRQGFPLPEETFRIQARELVARLRPLVGSASDAPADPSDPRRLWTVQVITKSAHQRKLRMRLSDAEHVVLYMLESQGDTLLVGDRPVARRYTLPVRTSGESPNADVRFEVADGTRTRLCTFAAYYGRAGLTRAALTVDGQVVYDEG